MDRSQQPNSLPGTKLHNIVDASPQRKELNALLREVDTHLVSAADCSTENNRDLCDEANVILHRLWYTLHARKISLSDIDAARVELERVNQGALNVLVEACELFLGVHAAELPDLSVFRDHLIDAAGPEMVVIPNGRFMMGSPDDESDRDVAENPRHEVTIDHRYCLGRYPVTFEEYDAFCLATNRALPKDRFWGRGRLPVINVVWDDAVSYCEWLSNLTGAEYRLPSEAEWEHACRAGTSTAYPWGNKWDPSRANGSEGGPGRTTLVGSYPANRWGLHDMIGNVREWTGDSWHESYEGAPTDGRAWNDKSGGRRVVRGGSWFFYPRICRTAFRFWFEPDVGVSYLGFRLARSML